MPREFGRRERVASQMQKELALVFQRDLDDARVGFITVNEVEVSKDLAVAKIYITALNQSDSEKKQQIKVLNELAPVIRHYVAKRMRLRHIADLRFYYDDSFDTGVRVAQLLREPD